jgi:putative MATE family efflux protein
LAALGVAATVLSSLFGLFNFLQYGTTAQVGRASGAGQAKVANRLGAQALWLSLGFGVLIAAGVIALAPQIVELMGVEGDTADFAVTYMRIASLGLPFAFLALGGQGYLRGVADLRTPLVIVIAANVANLALEVLFVYGFGWGIEGSAWGTVIAQAGMGAAFIVVILRAARGDTRPSRELMRRLLVIGRHIFVRTAALLSAFTLAGAVIARFGDASLAAHQIAFQLWIFLALVLDAVAIAGQVIVGRGLGAGDTERAYAASVRMIWLSVYAGVVFGVVMLAVKGVLPYAFTSDELVVERAQAIWFLFALMQPLNGAVFALDGILIGAGDGRFLMWSMVFAFATSALVSLAALAFDWGIVGVWSALVVLICVRLALMLWRFRGRRWLVTGWA